MRLLHFSDAHLDVPHSIEDLDSAELRRAELRAAFSSMMLYIRQNDVRLVLCSGDLFDHAFLTRETTALLRTEFASCPNCHFVIAPGNRDYFAEDSAYATTDFTPNVHIFKSPRPTCFPLDDLGVQVWGFAHVSADMGDYAPLAGLKLAQKPDGTLRMFCGHAALDGDALTPETAESGTPPRVTKEQLAACGFDYAALGYAHASDGIRRVGSTNGNWTYFGYAGCLIGRGFDECGARGAVCGTFDLTRDATGNKQSRFSVRRLRIARRHYEVLRVDFTDKNVLTQTDALAVIREAMTQAEAAGTRFDEDACVRVILCGTLSPEICLSEDDVAEVLLNVRGLELIDDTAAGQSSALQADATLRGAYYRSLLHALSDEDEDMRAVAADALRRGLCALEDQG